MTSFSKPPIATIFQAQRRPKRCLRGGTGRSALYRGGKVKRTSNFVGELRSVQEVLLYKVLFSYKLFFYPTKILKVIDTGKYYWPPFSVSLKL